MKELYVLTERDENGNIVSQRYFHNKKNALDKAEALMEELVVEYNNNNDQDIGVPPLENNADKTYFVYLIGNYAQGVSVNVCCYEDN